MVASVRDYLSYLLKLAPGMKALVYDGDPRTGEQGTLQMISSLEGTLSLAKKVRAARPRDSPACRALTGPARLPRRRFSCSKSSSRRLRARAPSRSACLCSRPWSGSAPPLRTSRC
jgi:hypothetical protein